MGPVMHRHRVTPHGKLLSLLCVAFLASAGLLLLAGCEGLLRDPAPNQKEAFDQIVPGMTRAEDLPAIGFDIVHAATLDTRQIAASGGPLPVVDSCLRAGILCTGYVFHPQAGAITLLVMNGRVIGKVFDARA